MDVIFARDDPLWEFNSGATRELRVASWNARGRCRYSIQSPVAQTGSSQIEAASLQPSRRPSAR
eukprot:852479-Pyramimonas_sp.AAC.1